MGIFVNGREAFFSSQDLPILISGKEGSGASYFSLCLIADFLRRGHKILFFSAFPAAKIDLMRQMSELDRGGAEFIKNGDPIKSKRAVILESGEESDILKEIKRVSDFNERIVFFKNMDKYSLSLYEAVKESPHLIISGDIDKCSFASELSKKDFSTKIFFSKPELYDFDSFSELKKYQGVVKGLGHSGVVQVIERPDVDDLDYQL